MKKVRFSVIIPAYNAESTLAACLKALDSQSMPREDYEVIVVDDGSTDGTSRIAKRFNINFIFQKNQGPAVARNRGANAAVGDIILFTDSDCVSDHNWIQEMVRPFNNPDIIGVKGAYKTRQTSLAARFAQAEFEDRYDLLQKYHYIDMIDTYSAAFQKDVFLKIGGFDEGFPVANNEDTDLSYRLVASGYKLIFNPRAFVYHTHPDTLIKYLTVKFWRGYWRMVVYRRYPDKAVKDTYTPKVVKIQTLLTAFSLPLLCLSWLATIFFYLTGLCWSIVIISSFPFSIKTFRKNKKVVLISPAVILLRSLVFAIGGLLGVASCLGKKAKSIAQIY